MAEAVAFEDKKLQLDIFCCHFHFEPRLGIATWRKKQFTETGRVELFKFCTAGLSVYLNPNHPRIDVACFWGAPVQPGRAHQAPAHQNLHATYAHVACSHVHTAAGDECTQAQRSRHLQRHFSKSQLFARLCNCTMPHCKLPLWLD